MNLFKNWRVSSSISKAQKLWSEFKLVSHMKDDPETINRLKKFLDYVSKSLKEFSDKNEEKKQIDDIVGEASDMLANLLQFLSDYDKCTEQKGNQDQIQNEFINQVLEIAEFILRDPKYRKQIENSPTILNDFLNVADKLEKSESKVIIVKLIIMIADDFDSKVNFVQMEGFSKLMRLFMDKDERVSRVISRALLHFLQIGNSEESRLLNKMQGQIQEKEDFDSIKAKIKKVALDFRKYTFTEIQRIFLQNETATSQAGCEERLNKTNSSTNDQISSDLEKNTNSNMFQCDMTGLVEPPNYEEIFETDLRILISLQINKDNSMVEQNSNSNSNVSCEQLETSIQYKVNSQTQNLRNLSQGYAANDEIEERKINSLLVDSNISIQTPLNGGLQNQTIKLKGEFSSDQNEEIFTILQGGFKAILETLQKASNQVQLNLMRTIQKLLNSEDIKYKVEFKKVMGYKVLVSLFKIPRNFREDDNKMFVQEIFNIYIEIIVSDMKKQQIMNFDAFEMIITLLSKGQQFEILSLLLDNLKKLFLVNWKNLLIARRLKATYHLLALTMRLFEGDQVSPASSILSEEDDSFPNQNNNSMVQNGNDTNNEISFLEGLKNVYNINSFIYYTSEITQKREHIGQRQREELLFKVNEIYKIYSFIEGAFSMEFEYAFAEIILKSIQKIQNKNKTVYFFDTLIEFLERKQNRKCSKIFTFDNIFLPLVECLKQIIEILLQNITNEGDQAEQQIKFCFIKLLSIYLNKQISLVQINFYFLFYLEAFINCQNLGVMLSQFLLIRSCLFKRKICLDSDECAHYLGRFLFFADQYLSCDHTNQIQNEEKMKQLEKDNTLIKYLICRNQCEEMKNIVLDKYVNKFSEREEVRILIKMINLKRMKNNDVNYTEYNYQIVTVLKDLLVNNSQRMQQFIQMEGMSVLQYIITKIIQEPSYLERGCLLFIDLFTNTNNSKLILSNPLLEPNDRRIPQVDPKRITCFSALFCTLAQSNLNDSHHFFFEYLSRLLLHSENMKLFRQDSYTITFFLQLLGGGKVLSSCNNLYSQILSIFERFIPKLSAQELKLVLDHLFNNINLKCLGTTKQDTSFFTDALSIISIHMLLKTNPLIVEKIISDKFILNLFGFLDSSNLEVKEMVLKVLIFLFCITSQQKYFKKFILVSISVQQKTKKKEGYGKKEQFYYLLGKKLVAGKVTQNICKILYDFTFWEDSPSILYPTNSSVVSTLFNRSEQAGVIIQKSQVEQQKSCKTITNVDMLEIFFKALREYDLEDPENENCLTFRNEMLSVLEAILDEPTNANIILEQLNFLNWLYVMLPNNWRNLSNKGYKKNIRKQTIDNITDSLKSIKSQLSQSAEEEKKYSKDASVNSNNKEILNNESINSLDGKPNNSERKDISEINTNEAKNVELNFDEEEKQGIHNGEKNETLLQRKDRSKISMIAESNELTQVKQISNSEYFSHRMEQEKVFQIVHKLMEHYFHKKGGDFPEQMKRFIQNDDEFLITIAKTFLTSVLNNCIVKDDPPQNFLRKFKDFVDSIDHLVGFDAEISILILQCIIKMVSKNSPRIRQIMKEMKFFDKRDNLIIRILTQYLDGDEFVKVFEGVSFDALVNHKEFQDKHTLSSILKILIDKQNNFSLQMLIISILKNPTLSEKNKKYVADILEEPKLIQFFYPSLAKRKPSSFAKCLQSNLNNSNSQDINNSRDEKEESDSDSNDYPEMDDESKRKKSGSKSNSSIQRGASFEVDFLHQFYSQNSYDLRKQIILRINVNLTPVLKQYEHEEKKLKKRRDESKLKFIEAAEKDLQNAQIKVSDLEYEINKKLKSSTEDWSKKQKEFNELVDKKLLEGENIFEKLTTITDIVSGVPLQKNIISNIQ